MKNTGSFRWAKKRRVEDFANRKKEMVYENSILNEVSLCRLVWAYLEPRMYNRPDPSFLWSFPAYRLSSLIFFCQLIDSVLFLLFYFDYFIMSFFIYSFQMKMQKGMSCSNMIIDDFRFNLVNCKLVLFLVISFIFICMILNYLF